MKACPSLPQIGVCPMPIDLPLQSKFLSRGPAVASWSCERPGGEKLFTISYLFRASFPSSSQLLLSALRISQLFLPSSRLSHLLSALLSSPPVSPLPPAASGADLSVETAAAVASTLGLLLSTSCSVVRRLRALKQRPRRRTQPPAAGPRCQSQSINTGLTHGMAK